MHHRTTSSTTRQALSMSARTRSARRCARLASMTGIAAGGQREPIRSANIGTTRYRWRRAPCIEGCMPGSPSGRENGTTTTAVTASQADFPVLHTAGVKMAPSTHYATGARTPSTRELGESPDSA